MTLRIGSRGPMVRHRQHQLKMLKYYHGRVDGIFGNLTKQAVLQFQTDHGLVPDGVIGPATAAALDRVGGRTMLLRLGSRGEMVTMLQHKLQMLGYYHGSLDGIFGPLTATAVKGFQSAHGLTPDGIVGPKTMAAIHQA